MSDELERRWIDDERPIGGVCHVYNEPTPGVLKYATEYVRADIHADMRAAADALADIVDALLNNEPTFGHDLGEALAAYRAATEKGGCVT